MYIVVYTNQTIHFIHLTKKDVGDDLVHLVNDCKMNGLQIERVEFAKDILSNW